MHKYPFGTHLLPGPLGYRAPPGAAPRRRLRGSARSPSARAPVHHARGVFHIYIHISVSLFSKTFFCFCFFLGGEGSGGGEKTRLFAYCVDGAACAAPSAAADDAQRFARYSEDALPLVVYEMWRRQVSPLSTGVSNACVSSFERAKDPPPRPGALSLSLSLCATFSLSLSPVTRRSC